MTRSPVKSINRALVILGEAEIRKWVSLVVLMHLAPDKPTELIVNAFIRAAFCESIAQRCGFGARKAELFLMGLFSMLDAIMDRPLEDVLKDIHLAPEIRDTLLGSAPSGAIALVFELIQRYERAEWQRVATLAECLQLECQEITECYLTAVHCCNDVFAIGDSRPV
jgi:EAL and modified HD-GYP domain-containing signal transduction protein